MHKYEQTFLSLSAKLGEQLKKHHYYLATAESCTGGEIAYVVTMTPGSSQWFERGFVSYSNEAKQEMLDVSLETLVTHGAVSQATVVQMAKGALRQSRAQVSIAVSGIAGPEGGSAEKPLGFVCFAWQGPHFQHQHTQLFSGNREEIRAQTVCYALETLISLLKSGQPH